MKGGFAVAAGLGLLAMLGTREGKTAEKDRKPKTPSGPAPSVSDGLDLLRHLAAQGGLTEGQTEFLSFVAAGESGLNPTVGLGDASLFPAGTTPKNEPQALQVAEAAAAVRAYEANTGWLADCGHDPASYGFGSGGWFGFLPTYALAQFKGTALACASPYEVFDPPFAIAAAYGFARGLTFRSGYLGTWGSLRSGWGLPSKIGDRERIARKTPRWRRNLRAVGLPASRLDATAPDFGARDLVRMYRDMGGAL